MLNFFSILWTIVLDTAPYVILGMVLSGLFHETLNRRRNLAGFAGGMNFRTLSFFTFGGLALPMCSCGVAPMAVGMRRGHGMPLGNVLAFLFAAPATSITALVLAVAMLGWNFTLLYLLGGLACGYFIGIVFYRLENRWPTFRPGIKPPPVIANPGEYSASGGFAARALRWGLGVYGSRIAFDQIVGLSICALAVTLFSVTDLSVWLNNLPFLLAAGMMVITALPLYVCSLPAIVMAATLAAGGLKPELTWIFLMAGPVTNLGDMNVLRRQMGPGPTLAYMVLVILAVFGWSLVVRVGTNPLDTVLHAQKYLVDHIVFADTCLLPTAGTAGVRPGWNWWVVLKHFFAPMYVALILLGALAAVREFRTNPCRHCRHWQADLSVNIASCPKPCWKKTVLLPFFGRIGSTPGFIKSPALDLSRLEGKKLAVALVVAVVIGLSGSSLYLGWTTWGPLQISHPEAYYRPIPTYLDTVRGYPIRFSSRPDQPVDVRFAGGPTNEGEKVLKVSVVNVVTGREVRSDAPTDLSIPMAPCRGFRDQGCDFPGRISFPPGAFDPGTYEVRLIGSRGVVSRGIYFNIRPESGASTPPIAVVYPNITWQAYNPIGGVSFYTAGPPALRHISLLRPIMPEDNNTPEAAFQFPLFLHRNGYDFFTIDDLDLHHHPDVLDSTRLLMIIVHDEYWTLEMRRHVEAFLKRGGNVLVAAGNTCWAKVRLEGPNIVINHKIVNRGTESDYARRTGLWIQEHIQEPTERTFGLTWEGGGYGIQTQFPTYQDTPDLLKKTLSERMYRLSGGMFVMAPEHPVFKDTGLKKDSLFGPRIPIVYKEVDGIPLDQDRHLAFNIFPEAPRNMEPLAMAYAWSYTKSRPFTSAVMVDFQYQGRGRVLNLGSIGWYRGIAMKDPITRRILNNAIEYLLLGGPNGKTKP